MKKQSILVSATKIMPIFSVSNSEMLSNLYPSELTLM